MLLGNKLYLRNNSGPGFGWFGQSGYSKASLKEFAFPHCIFWFLRYLLIYLLKAAPLDVEGGDGAFDCYYG